MYKLGVVSDSHGRISALNEAAVLLKNVDAVAHLGDYKSDSRYFAVAGRELFSVAGNCDGFSFSPSGEMTVEKRGHRLLICHGHNYAVKLSLTRLSLRARELNCDVVLYGHTHIPSVDTDGGIIFVNPGALMDGRYCVIEFRENGPAPMLYSL